MKKISFCFLYILLSGVVWAQTDTGAGNINKKAIKIYKEPRVDTLVTHHINQNIAKKTIQGYRIQIIASSNRLEIYNSRAEFTDLYPDIRTYSIYQTPYFKLRVGGFETKLKAHKFLDEIKGVFKGAFIVQDDLKLSELK